MNSLKHTFLLAVLVVCLSTTFSTKVRYKSVTESSAVKIEGVEIDNCNYVTQKEPVNECGVIISSTVILKVFVRAVDLKGKNTTKITLEATGKLMIDMPLPLDENDFCKSGTKCPLNDDPETLQVLSIRLPIPPAFPMKIVATATIRYEDGSILGKFKVFLRLYLW